MGFNSAFKWLKGYILNVHESVQRDTFTNINQRDATMWINLIFHVSSTCLGRRFRPSSGVFDCIYSI
jgi:hypothetical protein